MKPATRVCGWWQQRGSQKGLWAVQGLYPYLTGNVVRIVGKDGEYDDGDESSMWMEVEQACADKRRVFTVTLDESERG